MNNIIIVKIHTYIQPEYGRDYDNSYRYMICDSVEKARKYFKQSYSGYNCKNDNDNYMSFSKYYRYEECSEIIVIDFITPTIISEIVQTENYYE